MRAVFLFNLSQWRVWRATVQDGDRVFTTDVDVLAACRAEHMEVADLAQALSDAELSEQRRSSLRLGDALGEALREEMSPELAPLARHCSHELLFPLGHFFQVAAMARAIAAHQRPEEALAFAEEDAVFFWDPPHIPPDLANAAVRYALEQAGVPVERRSCPPEPNCGRGMAADQQHHWINAFDRAMQPSDVVLVGQGIWWSEMEAVLARRMPWTNTVVSLAWQHYVMPQNEYPDPAVAAWVERAFQRVAAADPAAASIFALPVIARLKQAWAGVIEAGIRYYRFGRLICRALAPRVVIHGYDTRAAARCFAAAVRSAGAEPISIFHGGINGMDHEGIRHRGAVGHVAVWSERDIRALRADRGVDGEIRAIGSLRADIHRALQACGAPPSASRNRGAQRPCVVFLTCRISGLYWFSTAIDRHVETWAQLVRWFEAHPGIDGIIKIHPRYDHEFLYGGDRLPPNLRVQRESLADVLARADAVALVNVETTAAIDAVAAGIPVFHLNTASRGSPDRWVADSGVIAVGSVAEWEQHLERLLHNPAAAIDAAERARTRLRQFVSAAGDTAVANLEVWIRELIEAAGSRRSSADAEALYRLRFARWIDEIFLNNPDAPPPPMPSTAVSAQDPAWHGHVLNRVVWYPWPPAPHSIARGLLRVHRHMPRAWRASRCGMRRYLVEALRLDARNPARPRVRRMASKLLCFAMAPRYAAQSA